MHAIEFLVILPGFTTMQPFMFWAMKALNVSWGRRQLETRWWTYVNEWLEEGGHEEEMRRDGHPKMMVHGILHIQAWIGGHERIEALVWDHVTGEPLDAFRFFGIYQLATMKTLLERKTTTKSKYLLVKFSSTQVQENIGRSDSHRQSIQR